MEQKNKMKIRRSEQRGFADHGWLKSYHSFSFADYFDRQYMNFRCLRVINEDFVAASQGFGTHPHENMEIVTLVMEGELAHKDSMGNASIIKPGEVQRMSAGTGVMHSEFNHSATQEVHLFQIWILPNQKDLKPSYEQKMFSKADKANRLKLIVSSDGQEGSVLVHQDMKIYQCDLAKTKEIAYPLNQTRAVWIQVTQGQIQVNGENLQQGDAVAIEESQQVKIHAQSDSSFLLFDLP